MRTRPCRTEPRDHREAGTNAAHDRPAVGIGGFEKLNTFWETGPAQESHAGSWAAGGTTRRGRRSEKRRGLTPPPPSRHRLLLRRRPVGPMLSRRRVPQPCLERLFENAPSVLARHVLAFGKRLPEQSGDAVEAAELSRRCRTEWPVGRSAHDGRGLVRLEWAARDASARTGGVPTSWVRLGVRVMRSADPLPVRQGSAARRPPGESEVVPSGCHRAAVHRARLRVRTRSFVLVQQCRGFIRGEPRPQWSPASTSSPTTPATASARSSSPS